MLYKKNMHVPQSDKGINVAVPPSNIDILGRGSRVQNSINSKVILGSLVPSLTIQQAEITKSMPNFR